LLYSRCISCVTNMNCLSLYNIIISLSRSLSLSLSISLSLSLSRFRGRGNLLGGRPRCVFVIMCLPRGKLGAGGDSLRALSGRLAFRSLSYKAFAEENTWWPFWFRSVINACFPPRSLSPSLSLSLTISDQLFYNKFLALSLPRSLSVSLTSSLSLALGWWSSRCTHTVLSLSLSL
jgi:hypothetical protein